ncbi:MAG: FG-GAP repeat protein [candidate division BRC1 bacterium ADurb.BinA292]|nr:MAG: FG-GAP repeat protein [candidate division BRC1 bacterium ADurb.BinA292]
MVAGDYSNDGKTDLSVAVNSFETTTSLRHYQRNAAGFSPNDDSEANILVENGAGRQSIFWQGIAIGDLLGDGVQTLVTSDINYDQPWPGHANPIRSLGFGPQRIYLHRRAGDGAFGTQTSVSDLEFGRENTEETTIAVGDITGDGEPDLFIVENLWNRSPGWGHTLTCNVMSANGGTDAGTFKPGDEAEYFDDPIEFVPNALLKVGIVIHELLWDFPHGQMGLTAMAIAGTDDLTRDGKADMAVARFDSFDGELYGNPPWPATGETNNLGVLEIRQTPANGAFAPVQFLEFDIEDFGPYKWTILDVADVTGDGHQDLLAVAQNVNTGMWHLWRYQWDKGGFISQNGAPSAAFPGDGNTYVPPSNAALLNSASKDDVIPASSTAITAMAAGNVDSDPDIEIVYALENGELYLIDGPGDQPNPARHWILY